MLKLDALTTPVAVFVGITRSERSRKCLFMPPYAFDLNAFGTGIPLNEKNELLLAHLHGD